MKYLLFLYVSFAVFTAPAYSQTAANGKVTGESDQPLGGASVLLLRATDSALVKAAVSDATGDFSIAAEGIGPFLLRAQMQGYTPTVQPYQSGNNSIVMKPAAKALNEVTVRGGRPLIEAFADKIVMNVAGSLTATGSTALELLGRAPGVSVDGNDNISLKGRQGVTIMIDGKLQPLSSADLATMLKAMPSDAIDRIEIISNPGARYDAAGTGGIINIRTKKDKRMGTNGSLNANYGQGIYPKTSGGASLNYRDKKLSIYTTYNYAWRKNINNLDLLRRFYVNGQPDAVYKQYDRMTFVMQSHTLTAGIDYNVTPKTVLGAVLTGGVNGFDLMSSNYTSVLDAAEAPASYFNTSRNNSNGWGSGSINLNLRHNLDTSGTSLTMDADYARYTNTSSQNLKSDYHLPDGTLQIPDYLLYGTLSGYTDIRSFKADFTKTFHGGWRLESGIKASSVHADNNPAFYDRSSGVDVYDSGKSNHFVYDETITAAYLNLSKEWLKWSLQAGLRGEHTLAKGHQLVNNESFDRTYIQPFPNVALTRHLNAEQDLGISLSRRIERPAYQQLNPFRRYLDVTSVNQGNPYLKPALSWIVELTHTWKSRFITQATWSRTTDVITQVIQPEAGRSTIVTDQNLATNTVFNLSGTYPIQPYKWWNAMLSFNAWYSSYEGNIAATPLSAGAASAQFSVQNTFTMPHDWSAELTGWYQSSQRYGYMLLEPNYVIGFGLQKSLLQGRATVKLAATDLLLHQNPVGVSAFAQYHEDFVVVRDSRVITLGASWRFGKRSVAPARARQRGADEELRRAASGGGAS